MLEKIKTSVAKLYREGALHITVGTFLTKFVAFFGSIVVVRILSKKEYGVVRYIENIYSYALLAAALGLSFAILRYVVLGKSIEEKRSLFDYIIKNSIIRNILIVIIVTVGSFLVVYPKKFADARLWVPVLMLLLPFQDMVSDVQFTFRSFFKNRIYAWYAFAVSVALIVGRVVGAKLGGVGGVVISRVVVNAAFAIGGFIVAYRMFFKGVKSQPLGKELKKEINVYSFQYMITNGLWALIMLNDTYMIGKMTGDPLMLADYGVAYVLPGNISILATAIGVFVAPYFTRNEKDSGWVRSNYKKVVAVSILVVGAICAVFALFARPLISVMYGKEYLNTVGVMQVLLIAAFINSGIRYTTANLLAAMGQIKYNLIVSGVGIVIQVILDYILIPKMGCMGVAVSNCIVYSIMGFSLMVIFIKKYYFSKASAA